MVETKGLKLKKSTKDRLNMLQSNFDDAESKLSHEKYIKKNADGTYDITLNATGSIGMSRSFAFSTG